MAWDQEEEKDQGVEERVIHFQIFKRGIIAGDSDRSRAWWGLAEMEWKSAAWREPGKNNQEAGPVALVHCPADTEITRCGRELG